MFISNFIFYFIFYYIFLNFATKILTKKYYLLQINFIIIKSKNIENFKFSLCFMIKKFKLNFLYYIIK